MTLRRRLIVAFAYLLLLAVVALSVPLAIHLERRARTDFAVRLTEYTEALAADAVAARRDGSLEALAAAEPDQGRAIITDADGTLLADSTGRRRLGIDYRFRPEVRRALEGRTTRLVRTYPTSGTQYIVAVPVVEDRRVVGAVRVQRPVAEVDALVRERLVALVGVSVAVLIVGMLVAVALAGSLTRPLRRLAATANRLGEGDLGARADTSGSREVAEVAAGLNAMSERIQQTLAAQSDFLANASHQLRTPLTGLRLRLEALQRQGAPGADAALAETDRLAGLVTDLLVLVRAGIAPAHRETVDVRAAAVAALERWELQAADLDHDLVIDGADGPPVTVAVSGEDLAVVFDNLIENALKYTFPGTTVTVSVERTGATAALSVADDGPGVAPGDRERVFERFYRGQGSHGAQGTGLGLAIVREIARRWGGDAELRTGDGTRVTVRLPLAVGGGRDVTEELSVASPP